MSNRGRPKKIIELSVEVIAEKLAQLGLKNSTISLVTGIKETTLRRNYGGILTKGREALINDLAAKQIELALTGNKGEGHPTMLIWLGKQYLGQSEKNEAKDEITLIIKKLEATKIE